MFTIEEKKFIFTSILCPSATKPNANINLAKCFNTYFVQLLSEIHARLKVLNPELIGFNVIVRSLCKIFEECEVHCGFIAFVIDFAIEVVTSENSVLGAKLHAAP